MNTNEVIPETFFDDSPNLPPEAFTDMEEEGEDIHEMEDARLMDEREDHFRDDVEADADALASAGWGTDEDYGGGHEME